MEYKTLILIRSHTDIVNQAAFQIEMVTNRLDMESEDNTGKNLGAASVLWRHLTHNISEETFIGIDCADLWTV